MVAATRQRSGEGNVLSRVCLCVCLSTGGPCTGPRPSLPCTGPCPLPFTRSYLLCTGTLPHVYVQTCPTWISLGTPVPFPLYRVLPLLYRVRPTKFVHYVACTVSMRAVGIRLERLIVSIIFYHYVRNYCTCSTTNILYSICCRCNNGWRYSSKILR